MLMVSDFVFDGRIESSGPKGTRGPLFSRDTLTGLCLFDEAELV